VAEQLVRNLSQVLKMLSSKNDEGDLIKVLNQRNSNTEMKVEFVELIDEFHKNISNYH
jgi:hypothetical protein